MLSRVCADDVVMKRLRVVVSLVTQDNDYQLEQAASAQEAAARLGVEVDNGPTLISGFGVADRQSCSSRENRATLNSVREIAFAR